MEWVDLYHQIPPTEENIPVIVAPFMINNSLQEDDEIEWAVKWM